MVVYSYGGLQLWWSALLLSYMLIAGIFSMDYWASTDVGIEKHMNKMISPEIHLFYVCITAEEYI